MEQRKQVLAFKKKVQRNALTCDYGKPSNFRDEFRKHIYRWLNERVRKKPQSRSTTSRSRKSSTPRVSSPQLTTTEGDREKSKSTSKSTKLLPAVESAHKKTVSTSSKAKKRSPTNSRSTTVSVNSSGGWVLLHENFFLTKSVETQADQSVILSISPADLEQEAALRDLQPDQFYKRQIAYAHQNEAAIMQVESFRSSSIKGKTTFILTLRPDQRSQGNSSEINFYGCSADEIARLRARLLLLNETPDIQGKNDSSLINSFVEGYDNAVKIKKSIFPDLWARLKTQPKLFLYHARLAAVYHLKMSRTVEHILEFKLTLTKDNVMSIRFRGQRKQIYGQAPVVIEVMGNCNLEA